MKGICLLTPVFTLALVCSSFGAERSSTPEKVYQQAWCGRQGGQTEHVLSDRTRVDCLTGEYAVEVDFAEKWAEAAGQALHYSVMTGKKAGVVLIVESPGELRFLDRLFGVALRAGIRVWVMTPEGLGDGLPPPPGVEIEKGAPLGYGDAVFENCAEAP